MSYGDGGFFFLQPVNNGYGALEFQPNPYGRIVEGKKFGRYKTLRQRGQVRSKAKKAADIAEMKAHVAHLQAKLASAKGKKGKKAREKRVLLRKALRRMKRNISVAGARGIRVGDASVAVNGNGNGYPNGEFINGNGEEVIDYSDDGDYEPAHETEDELLVTDNGFDVDEVDPLEDEVDLLLDETGTPVVVEDTESFYQRNRTAVMLVAGGLGIYALLSIARR